MEDRAFQNQRMVKRRLMEAQGGGEARRLHIVYFLSRKGYVEHPHLIRIHHLSRSGVRLRDIKRWLGELRGKDMPESFSWSYKRRYKTGYVWQDLMDDDLITPISDNEYVLKGSEIFSDTDKTDLSYSEKEILMQKEQSSIQEEAAKYTKTTSFKEDKQSPPSETSILISTRSSSSAIEESSPIFGSEISSLTYDSGKLEVFKNSVTKEQEKQEEISSLLRSKTKKVKISEKSISSKAASADKVHFTKSTSCSDGASHMFRKLITCHAVETNDSAVVTSHKQNRPSLNVCSSNQRDVRSAEMRKREKFGDSHMIFANCNSTQRQRNNSKSCDRAKDSAKKKGELKEQRTPRAAYKPLNGPNCSQCGQSFKPEKMHAHMKSCKGKKALANTRSPTISSKISAEVKNQDSASAHLLTY